MATLAELEEALQRAHQAGHTQAARQLAGEIQRVRTAPEAPAEEPPVDFEFSKMVENIPASAERAATETWEAIINPIDTAVALGKVAIGAGYKFHPLRQIGVLPDIEYEKNAEAVGEALKKRYGTVDRAKQTLMTDPVGVGLDALTVATGGGMAAATAPGKIGRYGKQAVRAAEAVEPLNIALSAGKTGMAKMVPDFMPKRMYRGAVPMQAPAGQEGLLRKSQKAVQTGIEKGYIPNEQGLAKINADMDVIRGNMNEVIEAAGKADKRIPFEAVLGDLKELRLRSGADGPKLNAKENLAAINKTEREFVRFYKKKGKKGFTVQELIDFKRDIADDINWRKASDDVRIVEQIQRAIEGKARKIIEKEVPDIVPLNQEFSTLSEIKPALVDSVARAEGGKMLAYDPAARVGTGAFAGPTAAGATVLGTSLLDLPVWKAKGAVGLSKAKKRSLLDRIQDTGVAGRTGRHGLLQSELYPTEEELELQRKRIPFR